MATADEIAEVREYVGEPGDANGWTAARIGVYVDREDDLFLAASAIWSAKAAGYADLVNVSESGSSRSMGQLIDNALKMAKEYAARSAGGSPTTGDDPIILTRLVRK